MAQAHLGPRSCRAVAARAQESPRRGMGAGAHRSPHQRLSRIRAGAPCHADRRAVERGEWPAYTHTEAQADQSAGAVPRRLPEALRMPLMRCTQRSGAMPVSLSVVEGPVLSLSKPVVSHVEPESALLRNGLANSIKVNPGSAGGLRGVRPMP